MSARVKRGNDEVSDAEIVSQEPMAEAERLDPLFAPNLADDYRARWRAVQGSFVDDPRAAVAQGDELVSQVLKTLEDSFEGERGRLAQALERRGDESTETLRLALRRYRALFDRLLSI